jgi:hypothetical protein
MGNLEYNTLEWVAYYSVIYHHNLMEICGFCVSLSNRPRTPIPDLPGFNDPPIYNYTYTV